MDLKIIKNSIEHPEGPSLKTADKLRKPDITQLVGIVFIIVLIAVFTLNLVAKDKDYSEQENRYFQERPDFSLSTYFSGRFEKKLDNYANDQFIFRNFFIKVKSASDITLGKLEANNVIRARDEYLMERIVTPEESDLKADLEALKAFKKKYKRTRMYFLMAPNAANLLSGKLPLTYDNHDQNKDIDSFFKSIKKLGYTPIDVRDELNKAKKKTQIYYRTDHHWTTDGAYIAYQKTREVMKLKSEVTYKPYAVKNDFVGTLVSKSGFTNGRNDAIKIYLPENDPKSKKAKRGKNDYLNSVIYYKDTKEKTTEYYELENLMKKDAYTVFGGTNHSLYTITTPTKKNKSLLVIKDSYANSFIPFLTQDYRTITVVDPRYYYENIATVVKANDVDEVLFIYNGNTFFEDNYLRMMLTNK